MLRPPCRVGGGGTAAGGSGLGGGREKAHYYPMKIGDDVFIGEYWHLFESFGNKFLRIRVPFLSLHCWVSP